MFRKFEMGREFTAICAIVILTFVGYFGYSYVYNQGVEHQKQEMRKAVDQAKKEAQNVSKKLQEDSNKALKDKDDKIKEISLTRDNLLSELRKRKTRDSGNSSNPGNTQTCTGAFLFREDAEFLAGEAARADKIIIERDYYFKQYQQVKEKLDEYRQKQND